MDRNGKIVTFSKRDLKSFEKMLQKKLEEEARRAAAQ